MPSESVPAAPVVLDTGAARQGPFRVLVVVGAVLLVLLVAAVLGVAAGKLVGRFAGDLADQEVGTAVASVIGIALLLAVVGWRTVFPPAQLVLESSGVRWNGSRAESWSVPWPELAGLALLVQPVSPTAPAGQATTGQPPQVSLVLLPRDPGLAARHPELARFGQGRGGTEFFRQPLGAVRNAAPVVEHGMRTFAPRLYRGVSTTGWN